MNSIPKTGSVKVDMDILLQLTRLINSSVIAIKEILLAIILKYISALT